LAKGLTHVGMLEWASTIVKRAKEAGYDAVWFKRQGDIGTVIINQRAFNVEKEI
jgi:sialic acid synthase SpsE